MSAITTHVLDTARGRPASGVRVHLEARVANEALAVRPINDVWIPVGRGETDNEGRVRDWVAADAGIESGVYRLRFDTAAYFAVLGIDGFYPEVTVVFHVRDEHHYHVPLLLSPYGYSTYRGS